MDGLTLPAADRPSRMKVAYLSSCYPAVSHTFIMREIDAVRERGVEVVTFSIRRPSERDMIDDRARQEGARTRCLVPPPLGTLIRAVIWAAMRPLCSLRTLGTAVLKRDMTLRQRGLWFFYFVEAIVLAYWLSHERIDRIHCHFGNNGASTGMLAAMLAGVPFSMTCHGSELLEPARHRLREKVARAAFVACVSRYGRAQLMLACPPQHWDKLQIVRCGLAGMPSLLRETAAAARRDPMHILCVGRLSHEKGHLVLIDALARLRDRGCRARATLIGDGPMRAAIESRLRTLRATDSVTLTGSLAPEAVGEYYQQADVLVLPSFSEGVPVVLMEAMACGLAVVATRVGGVPELVEHGVSGVLVAPGDADELATGIERVIQDPGYAARLGEAAVRAVQREFLIGPSAARLIELFDQHQAAAARTASLSEGPVTLPANPCLETS